MKTKVNSTVVIAGVFMFMILVLYAMKKKGEVKQPTAPAPAGTPLGKYPDWRILPYDPYKIGKGKVYDPHTLRMGIAPLSPSSWSSTYAYDPYDMGPAGR